MLRLDVTNEGADTVCMPWTKEGLQKLYFEKFGFTLTNEELEKEWDEVSTRTITPRGNEMNVAVSPIWLTAHIERELAQTGLPLTDSRFKKIREEIIPAVGYALFLKWIGYGEHVICSSDSPDIILIHKDDNKVPGTAYRRKGIPLEVTFITDTDVITAYGSDEAERVVHIIKTKKLSNQYGKEVTLLVVVDAILHDLEIEKVTTLLQSEAGNFHAVDLMINKGDGEWVMANVYPSGVMRTFIPITDLHPLMY